MAVFSNSSHHILWSTGDTMRDMERIVLSDAMIHSFQDVGIFDNVPIMATAPVGPSDGDKWLDTSTAPATARVYDGSAWQVATFETWFSFLPLAGGSLTGDLNGTNATMTGVVTGETVTLSGSYTPATLPPAAGNTGRLAYITGGVGAGRAEQPVYSDGTNWRKFQNGTIQA